MTQNLTTMERAFELAQTGECRSVSEIRRRLTVEGYSATQISGPTLSRQLRKLIKASA